MFSYQQTSRWLSFSSDPLTVEDWLANREVFGPVEKPSSQDEELERAYGLELEKKNDSGTKGIYESGNWLLVCAKGTSQGQAFVVDKKAPLKIRCKNNYKIGGKGEFVRLGEGEVKFFIDVVKL